MVVVFRARDLTQLLRVREIALRAVAHGHLIKIVFADVTGYQPRLERLILVRNLLMQFVDARWDNESRLVSDRVFQFRERSILVRGIAGCRRRGAALEIDVAAWEPGELGLGVHTPRLPISLVGHHYFLAGHLWQIVICGTSFVQISGHSLE